jgi:hypothetical protein
LRSWRCGTENHKILHKTAMAAPPQFGVCVAPLTASQVQGDIGTTACPFVTLYVLRYLLHSNAPCTQGLDAAIRLGMASWELHKRPGFKHMAEVHAEYVAAADLDLVVVGDHNGVHMQPDLLMDARLPEGMRAAADERDDAGIPIFKHSLRALLDDMLAQLPDEPDAALGVAFTLRDHTVSLAVRRDLQRTVSWHAVDSMRLDPRTYQFDAHATGGGLWATAPHATWLHDFLCQLMPPSTRYDQLQRIDEFFQCLADDGRGMVVPHGLFAATLYRRLEAPVRLLDADTAVFPAYSPCLRDLY